MQNVIINILELASELAENEMQNIFLNSEIYTIEDENGCMVYTENAQNLFNDLYDKYFDLIIKYGITDF
jgi:uncharacterized protein YehS (DUF1456 family)